MYSTCIFCKNSLGANEAIERFPVGRRLAFDAAKGRLWVVCRRCERWNLTPLEERWEAIEECERSFRGTKLRTSTDQIGLARLGEGLELVRIGKPLRPEFAAWRYGDQFGKRRRRNLVKGGALAVATAAIPLAGLAFGLSLGVVGLNTFNILHFVSDFRERRKTATRLVGPDGTPFAVRVHEIEQIMVLPPADRAAWGLRITHRNDAQSNLPWWYNARAEETDFRGDAAIHIAAKLLPVLNRDGAPPRVVKGAIEIATENDDPMSTFEALAVARSIQGGPKEFDKGAVFGLLDPELRLALEMISHEDSERRSMEGELHILEEAWREAEEIAAISDDLLLPAEVSARLLELKGDSSVARDSHPR